MPTVKQYCATCPPYFVLTVGDTGRDIHNSGKLLEMVAEQHKKEIESNAFKNNTHGKEYGKIPDFDPAKHRIVIERISSVSDLNRVLGKYNNILYLAYFGHGWAGAHDDVVERMTRPAPDLPGIREAHSWGALYIGDADAPDTNLGIPYTKQPGYERNFTPVTETVLSNAYNLNPKAQIRLFGCRGGFTKETIVDPGTRIPFIGTRILTKTSKPMPVAKQLAEILPSGIEIYGYKSTGGAFFTDDKDLGHGNPRIIVKAESDDTEKRMKKVKIGDSIWLVATGSDRGWNKFKGEK